ncbi:hypothetical protein U3516DRAFT_628295 [Neocallimastix sp. 'constans']|jgi:hypothetical protein
MQNREYGSAVYNYKNSKGNYLTPLLEPKTVIIVYIHGFLGSKNTFHEFPDLLKESMKLYNINIINKVFPAFDTTGVFNDFVNMIIDWLYENSEGYPIILMGHSMGGILNADVYRKISKGDVEPKHMNEKPPKIVAVFGFDTPYFGLSSATAGGGFRKIKESLTKASTKATNYVASFLMDNDDYNATNFVDGSVSNGKEMSIQTRTIPNNNTNFSPLDYISPDIISNSENNGKRRWNLVKNAVKVTATAAAYGSSLLNQDTREATLRAGQQMIVEKTQHFANYIRFLEPLIEISKQHQRVDDLINSARRSIICGKERFKFKNYYAVTQKYDNNGTINNSTFVCLPQEIRYLKYFDAIPGPRNSPDPVYSHTKIFNSRLNNENVNILANKCLIDMYKVIRTLF